MSLTLIPCIVLRAIVLSRTEDASTSTISTSVLPSSTATQTSANNVSKSNNVPTIVGLVVGGFGFLSILSCIVWYFLRRRRSMMQRLKERRHTLFDSAPITTIFVTETQRLDSDRLIGEKNSEAFCSCTETTSWVPPTSATVSLEPYNRRPLPPRPS